MARSRDAVQAAIDDPAFCRTIGEIAAFAAEALRVDGKLVGRLDHDRAPVAAIV